MWNLPGSGIESASPALTGGFFTAELLGTPRKNLASPLNLVTAAGALWRKFGAVLPWSFDNRHPMETYPRKGMAKNLVYPYLSHLHADLSSHQPSGAVLPRGMASHRAHIQKENRRYVTFPSSVSHHGQGLPCPFYCCTIQLILNRNFPILSMRSFFYALHSL